MSTHEPITFTVEEMNDLICNCAEFIDLMGTDDQIDTAVSLIEEMTATAAKNDTDNWAVAWNKFNELLIVILTDNNMAEILDLIDPSLMAKVIDPRNN